MFDFFFPFSEITVNKAKKRELYSKALQKNINLWNYRDRGEFFSVRISDGDLKILKDEFDLQNSKIKKHGIFQILDFLRGRLGIVAGLAVMLFTVWLSGKFVWDVRIEGNKNIDDDLIADKLAEAGLHPGSKISELKTGEISVRLLSSAEEISYVTINMKGNVAYVDVIEKSEPNTDERPLGKYANLVAASDGIIEEITVIEGNSVIGVGNVVKKGDLLVSGISSGLNKSEFVYAEGEVLARIKKKFRVEIPLENDIKVYSEDKTAGIKLSFFGKNINILKFSGNYGEFYDTIVCKEKISLFGIIDLPIYVEKTVVSRYTYQTRSLTNEEAVRLAYCRLNGDIYANLSSSMLVSKRTVGNFENGKFILTCEAVCIENIAVPLEFEAN